MHCELPPLTPDGRRPQALRGRRQVSRCLQLVTWGSPAGSFSFSESAAGLQDQLIDCRATGTFREQRSAPPGGG